jgi:hypothetical protein
MKRGYVIPALCVLSLLFLPLSAMAQIQDGCNRTLGQRLETARALVTLEKDNYASRINYWGMDDEEGEFTYKEPVFTNTSRQEMLDYLDAVFGGTIYGFPDDREVFIDDELTMIDPAPGSDDWIYAAATHWTGTFDHQFFSQSGMSIVKFRPGEACPYYHRDYWTEGDTWWNVPEFQPQVMQSRNFYILIMGLMGRCFDEDGDGYKKYSFPWNSACGTVGLDCNDFVAGINPGATEVAGNYIDDDCDGTVD